MGFKKNLFVNTIWRSLSLFERTLQILRTKISMTYPLINFNLQLFFEDALLWQYKLSKIKANIHLGNYYEFGVYRGDTMITFYRALKSFLRRTHQHNSETKLFAFDSFEGLPEIKNTFDKTPFWEKGQYACSQDEFLSILKRRGIDLKKVVCISGYYEDSLTSQLAESLKDQKPSIVTIDCDLYTSAITVLEWLRPLLRHGTLFYFDDIWSFCGHPDFGELKAINEFNKKNDGLLVEHHFGLGAKRVWVYANPQQIERAK